MSEAHTVGPAQNACAQKEDEGSAVNDSLAHPLLGQIDGPIVVPGCFFCSMFRSGVQAPGGEGSDGCNDGSEVVTDQQVNPSFSNSRKSAFT